MEGEINPQLYDNEVLPPLCQRPALRAADLAGVDHLGSSAEAQSAANRASDPVLSQRVSSCGVDSPVRALFEEGRERRKAEI